ncbi:MAG: hypothetical protein MHM6MM_003452 [Cercozoa sp. M6MM]
MPLRAFLVQGAGPSTASRGLCRIPAQRFDELGLQIGTVVSLSFEISDLPAEANADELSDFTGVTVICRAWPHVATNVREQNEDTVAFDAYCVTRPRGPTLQPEEAFKILKTLQLLSSAQALSTRIAKISSAAQLVNVCSVWRSSLSARSSCLPKSSEALQLYLKRLPVMPASGVILASTQETLRFHSPSSSTYFRCHDGTRLEIDADIDKKKQVKLAQPSESNESSKPKVLPAIGGMDEALQQLREVVSLPLLRGDALRALGVSCPAGVLLHGPPGCGKTLLARRVAAEFDASLRVVNGSEILSAVAGDTEQALRKIFEEVRAEAKQRPSMLFLDEVDALAPRRQEGAASDTFSARIVAQLLTLMDGISHKSDGKVERVVVLAATNRPNALDPALRRPGRFDREVEVSAPNEEQRLSILTALTKRLPLTEDVDFEDIARRCVGFVGADLGALCRVAAFSALKKTKNALCVGMNDFEAALKQVSPSALRNDALDQGNSRTAQSLDAFVGFRSQKQRVRRGVVVPMQHLKQIRQAGLRPPRGLLICGPSGCGKTALAHAAAAEAKTASAAAVFEVRAASLFSSFLGETEKRLREVFARARRHAPAVVIIDDVDTLVQRRELGQSGGSDVSSRVLSTLLNELDGVQQERREQEHVLVIATATHEEHLDAALVRSGRIDVVVRLPHPDRENRTELLEHALHERPLCASEAPDVAALVALTDGWSASQVLAVGREAALCALRDERFASPNDAVITQQHALKAIEILSGRSCV